MALNLIFDGATHAIEILRRKPNLVLKVDDRIYEISDHSEAAVGSLAIGGVAIEFARAVIDEGSRETCFLRLDGRTHEVEFVDPREASGGHVSSRDEIQAPMPGAIVSLHKQAGDAVLRGETIITIESMKLLTALASPRDGHIRELRKSVGETFEKDEILAYLVAADGD